MGVNMNGSAGASPELERERIIKLIERKFEELINYRKKHIMSTRKNISAFEKLRKEIIFLINNPDYVRVKDR